MTCTRSPGEPRPPTAPALLLAAALLAAPGCTATVLHDHFLGPERRLTVEWTDEAAWPVKPVALVGGVVCDGLIGAASIALWPADWVGAAGTVGWLTWQEGCGGAWWAAPVFPLATVVVLPFAPIAEAHGAGPARVWFPPKRVDPTPDDRRDVPDTPADSAGDPPVL